MEDNDHALIDGALELAALADPFRQYDPDPLSIVGMLVTNADTIRALSAENATLHERLRQVDEWRKLPYAEATMSALRKILNAPLPVTGEGETLSDDERIALIEACVKALTPMATNETHAWNLWNHLASDEGAIRAALEYAWHVMRAEQADTGKEN
jgi:hypothetical protein